LSISKNTIEIKRLKKEGRIKHIGSQTELKILSNYPESTAVTSWLSSTYVFDRQFSDDRALILFKKKITQSYYYNLMLYNIHYCINLYTTAQITPLTIVSAQQRTNMFNQVHINPSIVTRQEGWGRRIIAQLGHFQDIWATFEI
jgi:hypothetical protein